MTDRQPTQTANLDRYGNAELPWSRALAVLSGPPTADYTWFLGTVDADGRPHASGVGGLYLDGDIYFNSGPGTRKSRNLTANQACSISLRAKGIDLVFEGKAERVRDSATLEKAAASFREGGWPVEVEGDAFIAPYSAPSAGPPPWHLYRITFHNVVGVATTEPFGASRWRFAD